MFESLSDRLDSVFQRFKGQGRLDESNVQEGLREVRLALLEADVNFKVVRDFIARVQDRCLGQDVLKGLNPGQQVVKVVHEELIELLGGEHQGLELSGKPAVIMMVGLQGSGKTTTTAKLALKLRKAKMEPYMVPLDVYRPAAIEQLHTLAKQLDVPAYASTTEMNPVDIAKDAVAQARELGRNVVILDTAGRLHVDEKLMDELKAIKAAVQPNEILFVADAMTGQDAVTVAQKFDELLDISGVALTKMDGDARGGAALSIKATTGKPLKLVGTGEKLSELDDFYPDRMAGRILGMGDMLTLIEKAESTMEEGEAEELASKMQEAKFDLDDFRTQMRRLRKMGSLEGMLKMIPGMGALREKLGEMQMPEKEMAKVEAIINSMTPKERKAPAIINQSRKERIAKGSGTDLKQVDGLLVNFQAMRKMMQNMMGGKKGKKKGKFPSLPGMGKGTPNMEGMPDMGGMGGMPGMPGIGGMPGMPGLPGMEGGPRRPKSSATKPSIKKKKEKRKKKKKRK